MEPRNPRDMQGLLKFCIEATKGEDVISDDPEGALASMDPQRREWLEQALSSMSVDVIKELTEGIKILNSKCVRDANAVQDDIEKVEYAFECISDWVDQIDMANNFHKIGGFESLKSCLDSPHKTIRSGSANAIAELSQNNPYCQERFVEEDFIPKLLDIIANDKDCQVKAMYAVSCINRDSPMAQEKFLTKNGASIIMNACTSENEKMRIKSCFFISSLCEENEAVKKAFVDMGIARQLVTLMQMEDHSPSHEHMTRALLVVLRGNTNVKDELVNSSELKFKEFLMERQSLVRGKEEFEEENQYLSEIVKECYGNLDSNKSVDR